MRIGATTLEAFRLFMTEDFMTEADLIASIRYESVPNRKMQIGTAFGAVIEAPATFGGFDDGHYLHDPTGIVFDASVIDPMLALVDRRGHFEVKATMEWDGLTLVAKPDHIYGATITEIKTTLGQFSAEKYLESVQWRVDALVFEPTDIVYQVALLSEDRDGAIGLRGIETLRVFPYPGLREDVAALLEQFTAFVRARGLEGFLVERQREKAHACVRQAMIEAMK